MIYAGSWLGGCYKGEQLFLSGEVLSSSKGQPTNQWSLDRLAVDVLDAAEIGNLSGLTMSYKERQERKGGVRPREEGSSRVCLVMSSAGWCWTSTTERTRPGSRGRRRGFYCRRAWKGDLPSG